jgi:hypothetical protein
MHLNRLMTAAFVGTVVLCMVACSSNGQNGSGGAVGPTAIAAGNEHTCALTTAGAVYCWGINEQGQLGNNSTTQSNVPVQVVGVGGAGLLSGATAIAAGGYVQSHTCCGCQLSTIGQRRRSKLWPLTERIFCTSDMKRRAGTSPACTRWWQRAKPRERTRSPT